MCQTVDIVTPINYYCNSGFVVFRHFSVYNYFYCPSLRTGNFLTNFLSVQCLLSTEIAIELPSLLLCRMELTVFGFVLCAVGWKWWILGLCIKSSTLYYYYYLPPQGPVNSNSSDGNKYEFSLQTIYICKNILFSQFWGKFANMRKLNKTKKQIKPGFYCILNKIHCRGFQLMDQIGQTNLKKKTIYVHQKQLLCVHTHADWAWNFRTRCYDIGIFFLKTCFGQDASIHNSLGEPFHNSGPLNNWEDVPKWIAIISLVN